ncbi:MULTISPECIES: C40 family peptidase [Flavobacteriaceae]|uniref:Hydrolase Nlp/P60 n=2 Tax=Flavobacteriaceae TaxID=49546 RepID=A0A4Y8AQI2_9FLAO|nr:MULTISPECIES: C40 family peptidase [Flavobacteriaceae]TEW72088.1 hydrolase Nlp/P60 [Gramella jeungdoensis]GGK56310.1 hydrolase Nlp/P60 [Lutibacter litoralis]
MQYGICNLSIIPVRIEPNDTTEMVSQILFGEHFKVLELRKNWSKIRVAFDNYEGWIDNKQYEQISEETFRTLESSDLTLAAELIDFATDKNNQFSTVCMGSNLPFYNTKNLILNTTKFQYDGTILNSKIPKNSIIDIAYKYLNTPYLWGGKTHFGIDCSGFTQMVYKLCGYKLLRDASQQATQGEVLSFIEESEPGDLAFFDNSEGIITHVGIIMKDNYIIHAHGKVRIDMIDHSGIFNLDLQKHTHKLRVIKKII